jgi:hypothetical protein
MALVSEGPEWGLQGQTNLTRAFNLSDCWRYTRARQMVVRKVELKQLAVRNMMLCKVAVEQECALSPGLGMLTSKW